MFNILEADIEQISQLMQFAEALLEYHRQCSEILQGLSETLYTKTQAASSRQRREFVPKTLEVESFGLELHLQMFSCDRILVLRRVVILVKQLLILRDNFEDHLPTGT